MNFKCYTLVDITETKARRGEDQQEYKQQQNYMTFLQTLSLRVNPVMNHEPTMIEQNVSNFYFGSDFKGKHRVWQVNFDVEKEDALTVDMLDKDFNYVPVIDSLQETIKFKKAMFVTNGSQKNIHFIYVDNE